MWTENVYDVDGRCSPFVRRARRPSQRWGERSGRPLLSTVRSQGQRLRTRAREPANWFTGDAAL
jgi:hypothetical protein